MLGFAGYGKSKLLDRRRIFGVAAMMKRRVRGGKEVAGPNESIRLDLKAIYVAIPKTGSSSVQHQFRPDGPFLIPAAHLTIRQIEHLWHMWFIRQSLRTNLGFPTDTSLVSSDLEVRERSQEGFANSVKFATVRNPFARTLSLYWRRETIQPWREMPFEEFCEQLAFASDTCAWPTRNQSQIDWLTGWDNELLVNNVLRIEQLANDLKGFVRRFPELSFLQDIQLNNNPNSGSENYRRAYSASAREAVELVCRRDLEAFHYAF